VAGGQDETTVFARLPRLAPLVRVACRRGEASAWRHMGRSDEHLFAWRERSDPEGTGFRLSTEAAQQVGRALFVPMLAKGGDE
jgi:hypothetical protein